MVNIMGWWNKLVRDKKKKGISAKDKATAMGEPYIEVISVNFDKASPGDGFFELEWNKIFVQSLQDAGYSGTDEDEIVDAWFTGLCRQIAEDEG
jgi:hypothetical protein|tara:strand:+ start:240 stop:521 length:282 start_codon:yes stop_codon:yes gene_type:complete